MRLFLFQWTSGTSAAVLKRVDRTLTFAAQSSREMGFGQLQDRTAEFGQQRNRKVTF